VVAYVLLAGALINGTWQVICFYRLISVSFTINFALIRGLIRTSIPFLTYGVLGIIYSRIDTVLLSIMVNAATVGWYGAATRLIDTMGFLPGILIRPIMYPVFSKLSITSKETLKQAVEKSMNFLLVFGIPISTGLIVAAPNIINFLYRRPQFIPAIPTLQALAPYIVLLYANTVFNTIILTTRHERKITLMAAIALVFNLGLNFLLIPLYKQIGAAIVTTLTELLLLCLSIVFTPKHLLPLGSLMVAAKALIASLVMALAIWGLNTLNISNIFIIIPVAMVVYFSATLLLKTIPREDFQVLFRAIRHKTQRTSPTSL
jgi:O-antigen/teichoic acid export membrane protein